MKSLKIEHGQFFGNREYKTESSDSVEFTRLGILLRYR